MIIYLYHGTTVENALTILANRQLKGKKGYKKHSNRYVSFSTNKFVARQFGEVIFRFEDIEKAVPVELENFDWILENQEMAEFTLSRKEGDNEIKLEEQIILKNKHDFNDEAVTIYIVHDDVKHLDSAKSQLSSLLKNGDKITKNAKMYKDFKAWQ